MRRLSLGVLLLLLAPMVQAQSGGADARSVHVSDRLGDVVVTTPAGSQPASGSEYDHLDLTGIWIANETLTQLEVGVGVKRLVRATDPQEAASAIVAHFSLGKTEYNLTVGGCSVGGTINWILRSGSGFSSRTRCVNVRVDEAPPAYHFVIPREFLMNETSIPFGPAHEITRFAVTARSDRPASSPAITSARDRAPDDGFAPVYRSPLANVTRMGALRLFSPEPIRVSNGESTTLVYPVNLTNEGTRPVTALLSVQNPEPSWGVRVPSRLRVDPGQTVTFPAILSMEFTHRHGELANFLVRAEDAADRNSWSTIDLGVYWLETPQPAGHHDTVWAHSSGISSSTTFEPFPGVPDVCNYRQGWFNPLETDPNPAVTQEPMPGCPVSDGTGMLGYHNRRTYAWQIPLNPSLLIGLDFDLNRTGTLRTEISMRVPATASLEAQLLYCDPTKPRGPRLDDCPGVLEPVLQGGHPARSFTGGSHHFEIDMKPTPASDYLPYQRGSNLFLDLRLRMDRPPLPPFLGSSDVSPLLMPKATIMNLPLIEYHDPIDQAFQALGSLHLRPLGPFERPANPGDTIVFPFELANTGKTAQQVRLAIEGANAEWAQVLGSKSLHVAAAQRLNVSVAVTVPDHASPGERAEIFLVAENVDEPNVVALSRLRAAVVDQESVPVDDESGLAAAADGQESPFPAAAAIVLCLAVAIVLRRRRTD